MGTIGKIEPVRQTQLADAVEQRLCNFIRKNGLGPGAALPGEVELAERLNVSRTVVREALSRLRMLGVVHSKKRRGMVVGKPDIFGALERIFDSLMLADDEMRDLAELRSVLEMGMADLVYSGRTAANIKALEAIVKRGEKAKSKKDHIKHEIAFHRQLLQMTGNRALIRFHGLLEYHFRFMLREIEGDKALSGEVLTEPGHRCIVEALKHGTRSEVRKAYVEHFSSHFERRGRSSWMQSFVPTKRSRRVARRQRQSS